jgi:hypothetical protein
MKTNIAPIILLFLISIVPYVKAENNTGAQTLTFTEQDPASTPAALSKRTGYTKPKGNPKTCYKIEEESFSVYVPKEYTKDTPVWTHRLDQFRRRGRYS